MGSTRRDRGSWISTLTGHGDSRRAAGPAHGPMMFATLVGLVAGLALMTAAPALASSGVSFDRFSEAATFNRLSEVPLAVVSESQSSEKAGPPDGGAEPLTCSGCVPPLVYHGGAVMGPSGGQAGQVTLIPIYWVPSTFTIDAGYVKVVNQYLNDIAVASGSSNNVFAVNQEYYGGTPGGKNQIQYSLTTTLPNSASPTGAGGAAYTDTTAYPTTGACTADTGYTACVTDAQVQAELSSFIAATPALQNQTGLQYHYLMEFPAGVELAQASGAKSNAAFCGYHGNYTSAVTNATGPVIYSVMPYPGSGCTGSQWPQYYAAGASATTGTYIADSEVSTLSHEINEAMTDPGTNGTYSWYDSATTGNEIGDECAWIFGAPQGSVNTSTPALAQQSEYNQVINGHDYWTQENFSNATFAAFKTGQGCVQKAYAPAGSAFPTTAAPDLGTGQLQASPLDLPADGASTSTITETVTKQDGEPVVGDDVEFVTDTSAGQSGDCGTLSGGTADANSTTRGMTDANGQVTITYTASTDTVSCDVVANEAQGGTTSTVTVNQGTAAATDAPSEVASNLPTSLTTGSTTPVTFTTTATNPGSTDLTGVLQTIYLSGDNNDTANTGLDASMVNLSYSDDNTGGQFVTVPLTGTTVGDGYITGTTQPADGSTLYAGTADVTTWRLSLAAGAPASAANDALSLETDLDQMDASSGATSNLDYDTGSVTVVAGSTTTPPVVTPTTTTYVIVEPTQTIVQTVPSGPATAAKCTVPKLVGDSPAAAASSLKKAKCTSVTLVEPTTKKGQKLVVRVASPKAGTHLPSGGTLKVTFKAVAAKKSRRRH